MIIRKPISEELYKINELIPEGWKADKEERVRGLYDIKGYYPLMAFDDRKEKPLGFGQVLIQGDIAWLGFIMIHKNQKRKGIGTKIVKELIDYAFKTGIKTISLFATEEGKKLYSTLGFKTLNEYYFYRGSYKGEISSNISVVNEDDLTDILALDKMIMASDRSVILDGKLKGSFKYIKDEKAVAYYLKNYGEGQIFGQDKKAALELMKYKHYNKVEVSVFPAKNKDIVEFCKDNNFTYSDRALKMYLGEKPKSEEKNIFARGLAYTG